MNRSREWGAGEAEQGTKREGIAGKGTERAGAGAGECTRKVENAEKRSSKSRVWSGTRGKRRGNNRRRAREAGAEVVEGARGTEIAVGKEGYRARGSR